jgi:thioredoxin 1
MIITDQSFDNEIASHDLVLVDFWAPWCGPCKKVSPILDEISEERGLWVGKLNVDENPIKSSEYSVTSIPYMVLFKSGKPVKTIIGAKPKHVILEEIKEWI